MFIAWCLVCMLCTQKCNANLPGEQNSKGGESIVDDDVMYLFMVRATTPGERGSQEHVREINMHQVPQGEIHV